MDVRSAELTKYAANAMLATKISFMNELANLAERVGADIENVRVGIGSDPRIGYSLHLPGLRLRRLVLPEGRAGARGVGARASATTPSCSSAVEDGQRAPEAGAVREDLAASSAAICAGKTIALWGLAFKPNTDDMREAPSRTLMEALWAAGAKVRAYDPVAMEEARRIYGERADLDAVQARRRGAGGRRRAGHRHRVARSSAARLRATSRASSRLR